MNWKSGRWIAPQVNVKNKDVLDSAISWSWKWKSGTLIPPQGKINHELKIRITNWNAESWIEKSQIQNQDARFRHELIHRFLGAPTYLATACCATQRFLLWLFSSFIQVFFIIQTFYNFLIQILFLSLNISKLIIVKIKRDTKLSAVNHQSLEPIASPSMATAFVIPSSMPSPMSPATPNVTSSFVTDLQKVITG